MDLQYLEGPKIGGGIFAMKVIIIGLPYFAKKIAAGLAEVDPFNRFIALNTGNNRLEDLRFIWHLLSAHTVYLVGGQTRCGGTLLLARLLRKKVIMHWVGTDVLMALEAHAKGAVDLDLIQSSRHLCEVQWMKEELSPLGLTVGIAKIAAFSKERAEPATLPDTFSVLSYIGRGRELFYGLKRVLASAERFPLIPFRIVGIDSCQEALPANVTLLGWTDDMTLEFQRCVVYLRLPDHDGLSFSVLEAFSHGRYVGYSCPLPGASHIQGQDDLDELLGSLSDQHRDGTLDINRVGYDLILSDYTKPEVFSPLLMELLTKG